MTGIYFEAKVSSAGMHGRQVLSSPAGVGCYVYCVLFNLLVGNAGDLHAMLGLSLSSCPSLPSSSGPQGSINLPHSSAHAETQ